MDSCRQEDAPSPSRPDAKHAETIERSASLPPANMALLGEMTGGIVHDFRNLLSVIESGLRVAEDDLSDRTRQLACLNVVHDAVARGLRLTSRILDLTVSDELAVSSEDLNCLCSNLLLTLKLGAGARVKLVLSLASGIPKCRVEVAQFGAALLNLVINARDAMPSGGTIEISTASDEALEPSRDCRILEIATNTANAHTGGSIYQRHADLPPPSGPIGLLVH